MRIHTKWQNTIKKSTRECRIVQYKSKSEQSKDALCTLLLALFPIWMRWIPLIYQLTEFMLQTQGTMKDNVAASYSRWLNGTRPGKDVDDGQVFDENDAA